MYKFIARFHHDYFKLKLKRKNVFCENMKIYLIKFSTILKIAKLKSKLNHPQIPLNISTHTLTTLSDITLVITFNY